MHYNPEIHHIVRIFIFEEDGKGLVSGKDLNENSIQSPRKISAENLPMLMFQLIDAGYNLRKNSSDGFLSSYEAVSNAYALQEAEKYIATIQR